MANIKIVSTVNTQKEKIMPEPEGHEFAGYYRVRLGALNVENASGIFYEATTDVLKLFGPDSIVGKNVQDGCLYGEDDHPIPLPGETDEQFLYRQLDTRKENVTHHIVAFDLEQTEIVDTISGLKKIIVWGWIKPYGDKGHILASSLENPNMSTSFSMRSMVNEIKKGGRTVRRVAILITWDFVLRPGIKGSSDWGTLGYEFDKSDIEKCINLYKTAKMEQTAANEAVNILCDISKQSFGDSSKSSIMRNWI